MAVGCTRDILRQSEYLIRLSEIPWVVPTFVVIEGEVLYYCPGFFGIEVTKLTTGRLVNVLETSPCFGKRFSMMLLEHRDIIMEFCGPSRWKELSKESGSKILPCGDGSCWKAFKPIASLIA
ncbi:hypothetical protein Tco_1580910 [Tanacetum coccineum]